MNIGENGFSVSRVASKSNSPSIPFPAPDRWVVWRVALLAALLLLPLGLRAGGPESRTAAATPMVQASQSIP